MSILFYPIQNIDNINQISLLMQPPQPHPNSHHNTANFKKGMTLSQYMSQLSCQRSQQNEDEWQQKQQNLYANQEILEPIKFKPYKQQYQIKEVDQVSHQDSYQSQNNQLQKMEKEQLTKETFRQTNYFQNTPHKQSAKFSMNATAYFNNNQADKNHFRIKHLSNNPYKKKAQANIGATLTLYGRKFSKSIGKQQNKIPQLATFYGKLKERKQEKVNKAEHRRGMSRHNFKKKNPLQIQDLIKFEQNIKNNYSQKIYFQDIKVEGIKDKINERKNRLC